MQTARTMPRLLKSAGLLKHWTKSPVAVQLCQRLYTTSSETDKLSVKLDDSTGIALMTMRSKPANLFDLEFMTDISNAMDKLHADKSCKGLIITSGVRGIFSGGLLITEVYRPKQERFNLFWGMLQDMLTKVYSSRLATVAAINGHSPAGGCMLGMCCDYRIMASGKYTIGLNETRLGIAPPTWFSETMVSTIGQRQADRALQQGTLFPVDQALKVGLIDEVCEEQEILDKAQEQIRQWLSIPEYAKGLTKDYLRQPFVDRLMSRKQADIDFTFEFLGSQEVHHILGKYLENLKKKSR